MYRLYGKDRKNNYELITIVQSYEEAEQIVLNDTRYINILVIKREHNTDEIISIEKPKVKTLTKNFK